MNLCTSALWFGHVVERASSKDPRLSSGADSESAKWCQMSLQVVQLDAHRGKLSAGLDVSDSVAMVR